MITSITKKNKLATEEKTGSLLFVGIDIGSKENIVWYDNKAHCYTNDEAGFQKMLADLRKYLPARAVIGFESTGSLSIDLVKRLLETDIEWYQFHAQRVRAFASIEGYREKSDEKDAHAIADYLEWLHMKGYLVRQQHVTPQLIDMKKTEKLISSLTGTLAKLKTQLKLQYDEPMCREVIEHQIASISEDIARLKQCNEQKILADKMLSARYKELIKMEGIGKETARKLLILLPELGYLRGKTISALAGLSPYRKSSSGKIMRSRIGQGRSGVCRALHMGAVAVRRRKDGVLRTYCNRLAEAGKSGRFITAACMHKMLLIANAKLRDFMRNSELFREP